MHHYIPLDHILVSPDIGQTLTGDSVPDFMKLLQKNPFVLGDVEQNKLLRGLSVFGESTEDSVNVDLDGDALSVTPRLVFHGPKGQRFALTAEQLRGFEKKAGFRRTNAGWIEVTPETVNNHIGACRELIQRVGDLSEIRGRDIPETLIALGQADKRGTGWSSPRTVYFSQSVRGCVRGSFTTCSCGLLPRL